MTLLPFLIYFKYYVSSTIVDPGPVVVWVTRLFDIAISSMSRSYSLILWRLSSKSSMRFWLAIPTMFVSVLWNLRLPIESSQDFIAWSTSLVNFRLVVINDRSINPNRLSLLKVLNLELWLFLEGAALIDELTPPVYWWLLDITEALP